MTRLLAAVACAGFFGYAAYLMPTPLLAAFLGGFAAFFAVRSDEQNRALTLIRLYQKTLEEISQTAGQALGYPWFKDDQKNFPGATEEHGVCIGDHVPETIVDELATRYRRIISQHPDPRMN
jgi:hypothetical protein